MRSPTVSQKTKRAATFRPPPFRQGGLRGVLLLDQARNQEVKHGDDTGGGGTKDEAFETGFVDFGLTVHGFGRGSG